MKERYYYKHVFNGGLMNLKSPINDLEYIQITKEEYEELAKISVDEFAPVNDDTLSKIIELKIKLAKTDYQAIKFAEGWLSEEEFAPIKAKRQELRNKINELESTY